MGKQSVFTIDNKWKANLFSSFSILIIIFFQHAWTSGIYHPITTTSTDVFSNTNECRQVITAEFGYIRSPNFPGRYPRYSRCSYVVAKAFPDVCEVKLTLNQFDVARMTFTNCSEDFLELQDKDRRLRICGELPAGTLKFVSFPENSSQMVINFRSTFHENKGFDIQVKQLRYSCTKINPQKTPERALSVCARNFPFRQGVIRLPESGGVRFDHCTYLVRRSDARACLLQLDFSSFDVPQSVGCEMERFQLPDGTKLCGVLGGIRKYVQFPPEVNELRLHSWGYNNSFSIQVTQLPGPCESSSSPTDTSVTSVTGIKIHKEDMSITALSYADFDFGIVNETANLIEVDSEYTRRQNQVKTEETRTVSFKNDNSIPFV